MAWVRCSGGGSFKPNYNEILVNGVLNSAYTWTGSHTDREGYIEVGTNCKIIGVDFTDLSAVTFDYMVMAGTYEVIYIDGNIVQAGARVNANTRKTYTYNASSTTGFHTIGFSFGDGSTPLRVYNVISTPTP